jgi:hypothetical protein
MAYIVVGVLIWLVDGTATTLSIGKAIEIAESKLPHPASNSLLTQSTISSR